ncbi:MAG: hypothetical protein JF595_04690 [Sphingomonadales bacterium]|nr:hypothetical protein [Sphingomonadales bacterium]
MRADEETKSDTAMGLFKADFYRFFAIGFGAGALLVAATIGIGGSGDLPGGVVPSAVAAPAR